MIRKINLMGVPLQVEDLLFNIDRKKAKKEMMLRMWGRRATSGTTVQIWPNPQRGGAKARHSQVLRLGMILQAKMIVKGLTAAALHHALHGHPINALWQEVKQVSHRLVMTMIVSAMMRESPP
jgi:hypothetical protein